MILTVAVALFGIGLALWIVGTIFQYTGIAVIGAVVILGVGGVITIQGLEYRSGETVENTVNYTDNTSVVNASSVSYDYQTQSFPASFSLGLLLMLSGGVLTLRSIEEST